MRIALTEPMRVRQVERSKRLNCALARLRPAHQSSADRPLTDLVKKTHRRIERRRSALGNIGDARTPYAAPPSGIEATQISSPQQDASADYAASRPRIGQRGKADRRFAGSGFADQAEYLPARKLQIDIVNEHIPRSGLNAKPFDAQNLCHISIACPSGRAWEVANRSTSRLIPIVSNAIAPAGYSGAYRPKLMACAFSRTMEPQ